MDDYFDTTATESFELSAQEAIRAVAYWIKGRRDHGYTSAQIMVDYSEPIWDIIFNHFTSLGYSLDFAFRVF